MAQNVSTLDATDLAETDSTLNELGRVGALVSRDFDLRTLMSVVVEQSLDVTKSDLSSLLIRKDLDDVGSDLRLVYYGGKHQIASCIAADSQLIEFVRDE